MKREDVDSEELRKLVELDGLTHRTVAEKFGVRNQTISKWCRHYGVKTQRVGPRSGSGHTGWKGGIRMMKGYKYLYSPNHPNRVNRNYVAEHRLVIEKKIGRYLERQEVVHHIDGNPLNNHPDNLVLFSRNSEHLKHELTGKCPKWTPEGKKKLLESARKGKYFSKEVRRKASERAAIQNKTRQRMPNGRFASESCVGQPPQSTDHQTTQSYSIGEHLS